VAISTYSVPDQHPWFDIGKPVAGVLKPAGDSMLGLPSDSMADTWSQTPTRENIVLFKSADAIGNLVGAILSGNGNFEFPDFNELMKFPSEEIPRIAQMWASVPSDLINDTVAGMRSIVSDTGQALTQQIGGLATQFGGTLSSLGNMGALGISLPSSSSGGTGSSGSSDGSGSSGNSGSSGGTGGNGQNLSYGDLLSQLTQTMSTAGMGDYICPGGSGPLSIQYQSDLDSTFWRGKLPLELLYPGSLIPGVSEVGQGLVNTWGGTYPRIGELTQAHPVKASAVIAARVASIIDRPAQPHIYKKLYAKGGSRYIYFKQVANPKFQAVFPVASTDCITFGSNDSLSLGSYGDYKTSGNNGFIWNLWHTYECCARRPGIFLFAVP
jgi:integrating conjugative element protein (TIGR03756 family)